MSSIKAGDKIHGFTVEQVTDLPEYRGKGVRLRHDATGAGVFHLHNDDKENLFSFAFKTPATDNTGAAHILEHCVLAGSEKYPVKDPFLSMMNGSMNTFLNAMTYPDKTVYPAASTVPRDYFNLMSVYIDAVFFPLLREEMFMQEGIRFEPADGGEAVPSGVVFNEMKGAYSNHDSIAAEYSNRFLFPESTYRFDSGGEPAEIPGLSYAEFRKFHERFYHPSNCRIFLYGDIDTAEQLEFIQNSALSRFSSQTEPAEDLPIQKSWDKPVRESVTSSLASEGGEDESGTTISLNWKCDSSENSLNILKFEVLSEALMGNMGAPIYKAVVESGIGEDLSPVSGLDTDLREMVFSVGIRGSRPEKLEDFEQLIETELQKLVSEGIPEVSLQGAIHRVEFRNREIRGGAPFGLRLMGRSLKGWLHGYMPDDTITFREPMEALKAELEMNPRLFEELIQRWLLENNHRLTLVVEPSAEHNDRIEEDITAAVRNARAGFDENALAEEKIRFESFRKFQQTADSAEDAAKIPSLDISDVPAEISRIKTEKEALEGVTLFKHDLFTNGIIYIDFAVDIRDISDEEGMLLPFLSRMVCSSGLPGKGYDEVALDLALKTGGLYTFLESSRTADGTEQRKDYLFFRMKTLEDDLDEAFELVADMLLHSMISDPVRVKDLLLEMRNDFKASILPAGHSYCSVKASAEFDRVMEREDEWRGVRQFLFLNKTAADMEASVKSICRSLDALRKKLIVKKRLVLNITGRAGLFKNVEDKLKSFIGRLDEGSEAVEAAGIDLKKTPSFSMGALSVPSSICFSSRCLKAAFIGTAEHAHQSLLAHMLKTNDLWEEVRMKNGAYGVYASVNGTEGLMTISTYRDPAPVENLDAAEHAIAAAAAGRYDDTDLKKAIITVVGRDLKPLSPGEKSLIGFRRDLYGITDHIRQHKRDAMLSASASDIRAAAESLLASLKDSVAVVMGPESIIQKTAEKYGAEVKDNTTVLPL